jgi:DNA-directed RNA polymerase subunit H (RpoH/RPB5)
MIIDRGYQTMNEYLQMDDNYYLGLSRDDMINVAFQQLFPKAKTSSIFNAIYSNGKSRIAVFYLEVEKGKEDVPKGAIIPYTSGDIGKNIIKNPGYFINDVIFISPKKLNTHAVEEIGDLIKFGIGVQSFTWIEMLSICPNHLYNGSSRIMDKVEEEAFVSSLISGKANAKVLYKYHVNALPNFATSDPIPKYYGAKSSSIITTNTKIFTHISSLQETTFFRKVL